MNSLILVFEFRAHAPTAVESESSSQATYKAMSECMARGNSWQDAMDQGETLDGEEKIVHNGGKP
jgi:hypothetical protein